MLLKRLWCSREALLAVVGVVLLCLGVFLIYPPAGFIVAGVAAIVVAYVARYLEVAKRETS